MSNRRNVHLAGRRPALPAGEPAFVDTVKEGHGEHGFPRDV